MPLRKTFLTLLAAFLLTTVASGQQPFVIQWATTTGEVATDYNTCLMGVKDPGGQWIIAPQYEQIYDQGTSYVVSYGGKSGVLDPNGKVIVPLTYDRIEVANGWRHSWYTLSNYYIVWMNDKAGVVDSSNRIVVPVEYISVNAYSDTSFVARKSKNTYVFYNAQGTAFACPWKSRAAPYHGDAHRYSMRRRTLRGKKYGVLNDSGQVIVKRRYDYVQGFSKYHVFKLQKGKKYGYCSSSGKMIWPVVFSASPQRSMWNRNAGWLTAQSGIGPATVNGKTGLISIYGDTLLPFAYDAITSFGSYNDGLKLWEVRKDSLSGIYDPGRGWLLEPACSVVYNVLALLNEKDSSGGALLVARMRGKWGAMTTSGQVIIPFECSNLLRNDDHNMVFEKNDSLLALNITPGSAREQLAIRISGINPGFSWWDEYIDYNARMVPADNQLAVFHGREGVRVFYHPGKTRDPVHIGVHTVSLSTGNYYGMNVPDSILNASCFQVIPVLQPLRHFEQFDLYAAPDISDHDSSSRQVAFCRVAHHGKRELSLIRSQIYRESGSTFYITQHNDVLKSTGTVVISGDSTLSIISRRHAHDGSLYFSDRSFYPYRSCAFDTNGVIVIPYSARRTEDFSGRYAWVRNKKKGNAQFTLLDIRTGENLLGKKEYAKQVFPIWDSITVVETDKNGSRIFNIKQRQYLSTKGYAEIFPLRSDGTLFAVKTCAQHIGVVDASGKTVLDTLYTALTFGTTVKIIYTDFDLRHDLYTHFYQHVVFYTDGQMVVLETATGTVLPHAQAIPVLWQATVTAIDDRRFPVADDSLYRYQNKWVKHIEVFMSYTDSVQMLPWQQQCIIDSLYTPKGIRLYRNFSLRECGYCGKDPKTKKAIPIMKWTKHSDRYYPFVAGYRNDSLVCYWKLQEESYSGYSTRNTFSTVMLFNDGPHQMTLDSLFDPASDWRNFIINTLITYVNTHNNINGDCHNPAGIPLMLSRCFEVTPSGLLLYPDGFTEHQRQLVLHVPWQELDPYLRTDIRSRLPITPQ